MSKAVKDNGVTVLHVTQPTTVVKEVALPTPAPEVSSSEEETLLGLELKVGIIVIASASFIFLLSICSIAMWMRSRAKAKNAVEQQHMLDSIGNMSVAPSDPCPPE